MTICDGDGVPQENWYSTGMEEEENQHTSHRCVCACVLVWVGCVCACMCVDGLKITCM